MDEGALCGGPPSLEDFPVWDSHVHCYPPEVIADPQDWARRHRETHWGRLVRDGPQGWADPEQLIQAMDRDGIGKVLLQAWYWENPDTARLQNDWHAEWIARHPGRLMACASVHPGMKEVREVLQEARGWGAVAVGECLPQVQTGQGWAHPGWKIILDQTTELGWPVVLHVTESAGHDYPGRVETPLCELLEILESRPRQKWILAHWGGGLPFYSLNKRVRKALKRVWFDTAASPLLYDARIWHSVVALMGAEQILFGSDFPLRLYPGRQEQPGWSPLLKEFRESGLSEPEVAAISWRNLARLLG